MSGRDRATKPVEFGKPTAMRLPERGQAWRGSDPFWLVSGVALLGAPFTLQTRGVPLVLTLTAIPLVTALLYWVAYHYLYGRTEAALGEHGILVKSGRKTQMYPIEQIGAIVFLREECLPTWHRGPDLPSLRLIGESSKSEEALAFADIELLIIGRRAWRSACSQLELYCQSVELPFTVVDNSWCARLRRKMRVAPTR